jgi:hypothetical protein
MFGFSFAIPVDAQQLQSQPESATDGDFNLWSSPGNNDPLALGVSFGGARTGLAANQCPQGIPGATIVTVGSGIKGYQLDDLVIGSLPPGAAAIPNISASFMSNGVMVSIELMPQTKGNLGERYGGIWREMLASFTPGVVVNPSPLCAG